MRGLEYALEEFKDQWRISKRRMVNAEEDAEEAMDDKESGPFREFLIALKEAILCTQLQDYMSVRYNKLNNRGETYPNAFKYFDCIVNTSKALEKLDDKAREETTSEGFRSFVEHAGEYRIVERRKPFLPLLWFTLFAALWFVLYGQLDKPFMAEFIALPALEEIAYAVFIGMFFVIGLILLSSGKGFVKSAIISAVLDIAYVLFSVYGLENLLEWANPAFAKAAENMSEYVYILFLTVFVITALPFVFSLMNNGTVTGKRRLLKAKREEMADSSAKKLSSERDFFGLMCEICDICRDFAEREHDYTLLSVSHHLSESKTKAVLAGALQGAVR